MQSSGILRRREAAKRLKNLRLKAARVGCDLSQEELAAKVGVTRQTIGMIEAGRFNPSLALCGHLPGAGQDAQRPILG